MVSLVYHKLYRFFVCLLVYIILCPKKLFKMLKIVLNKVPTTHDFLSKNSTRVQIGTFVLVSTNELLGTNRKKYNISL